MREELGGRRRLLQLDLAVAARAVEARPRRGLEHALGIEPVVEIAQHLMRAHQVDEGEKEDSTPPPTV